MLKTKRKFKIKKVTHTKKKNRRPLIICIVAFVALVVSVFVFWDDIICYLPYCDDSVTKYVISSNSNRKIASNGPVVSICGTDGLYMVNNEGKDTASFINAFPDPLMAVSSYGTAVTSKNSKEFFIIDKKGGSRKIATEHPVLNLKLTAEGYSAAIMDQPGYNGSVTVYDKKGIALFNWHAGKSNLIDADISNNGSTLAISCTDFSENTLKCKVLFFDIGKSAEPYQTLEVGDNLISAVEFSGDKILCVGDKAFIYCNIAGHEQWRIDYEGKLLNFYDVSQKDNLVFVLGTSSLDRNMTVMSYSSGGKLRGTYSSEFDISHICATKHRIIIASKRKLLAVSPQGNLKNTKTVEKDILAIAPYSKGNKIFVDEGGNAEIFMFK